MYGLSRYAGIGPSVTLDNSTFTLHAWTLRDWGAAEAEVLHLRGSACSWLRTLESSEWAIARIFERLQDDGIWATWREIMDWRDTPSGRVFTLSRSLKIELEEARRLLGVEYKRHGILTDFWWWTEIQPSLSQANCEDELSDLFAEDLPHEKSTDAVEDESLQWLRMFSGLSRKPYSMSPEDVLDLTFWQARALMFREEDSGGFNSPAEMQAHFRGRKKRAERAAHNLKSGRRYDDDGRTDGNTT